MMPNMLLRRLRAAAAVGCSSPSPRCTCCAETGCAAETSERRGEREREAGTRCNRCTRSISSTHAAGDKTQL
ncbi:unnamed protein product [Pleuronectes platessa]|uniref:Uncharacterized protein n=1 Tax=Pleuronectes platessa TaxID=8262 RepID=A0A9N7VY81_PLEPL|nr:unnamed protein product [Pleuronectes platessa]